MIQGYHNPFCTPTKSRNGGVAIFIKDTCGIAEREDCNIMHGEFESVWIEIKQKKCKNIVIGYLYRHPHYSNIDDFSSYVDTTLNKLNKENKQVYISGDFNIDLLKYNSIYKHQEFYNLMTANGYLPQIIQPTRITETTMTIIDNIYTNTFINNIISGNLLIEIADHLVQFVSVNKEAHITNEQTSYRSYKNWNEQSFLDDLSIQNWSTNQENGNDSYNDFIWSLKGYIDRHAPLKKLNKREIKLKNKPWVTTLILKKIKHRNEIFARLKKHPSDAHLKASYNKFKNYVNKNLKNSKKNYFSSYFDTCKNNMKKIWKRVNEIITKSGSYKVTQLYHKNSYIDDPKLVSETFNNFFVNVGSNLEKKIPLTFISPTSYLKTQSIYKFHINTSLKCRYNDSNS